MEKITIYGRPACPYCDLAVALCEQRGFAFTYIDIQASGMSIAELQAKVGQPVRTVPQIFVGSRHVGGYTDFYDHVIAHQNPA